MCTSRENCSLTDQGTISVDDGALCIFTKQSGTAKLLESASLIIWDEASMTKRQAVEALDNSMREIMARGWWFEDSKKISSMQKLC
jgi:hypothetical protein